MQKQCKKCNGVFQPHWLRDGMCNGCKNPHLIVKSKPVQNTFMDIRQAIKMIEESIEELEGRNNIDVFNDVRILQAKTELAELKALKAQGIDRI